MEIFLIVLCVLALASTAFCGYRLTAANKQRDAAIQEKNKLEDTYGNIELLRTEEQKIAGHITAQSVERSRLNEEVVRLTNEVHIAQLQRKQAVDMAEKDLELEKERRKAQFEAQLDVEFKEFREKHPLTQSQRVLDQLNLKIEEARRTLKVQQEQAQKEAEKEDFNALHTLGLTEFDQKDIDLIRQFAPRLSRQEAFYKLIWTEFYQKPLQALRKVLNADKVTGIYKITNTKTGRMYIGQAVDIGVRWAEHVKCGLGIGSTSYTSNKFYKAMHDDGPENFTFEVLELCDRSKLSDRERYWIDFYNSTSFGYNTKIGG